MARRSIRNDILKNLGEMSQEDFLDNINEDDEILANSVEAEARLIQAFSNMMKEVRSLKYLLKPSMGVPYGSDEMNSMKDMMKGKVALSATKAKLKGVVAEKMPILHSILKDVIGEEESEEGRCGMRDGTGLHKKKVVVVRNTDYDDDEDDDDDNYDED